VIWWPNGCKADLIAVLSWLLPLAEQVCSPGLLIVAFLFLRTTAIVGLKLTPVSRQVPTLSIPLQLKGQTFSPALTLESIGPRTMESAGLRSTRESRMTLSFHSSFLVQTCLLGRTMAAYFSPPTMVQIGHRSMPG